MIPAPSTSEEETRAATRILRAEISKTKKALLMQVEHINNACTSYRLRNSLLLTQIASLGPKIDGLILNDLNDKTPADVIQTEINGITKEMTSYRERHRFILKCKPTAANGKNWQSLLSLCPLPRLECCLGRVEAGGRPKSKTRLKSYENQD